MELVEEPGAGPTESAQSLFEVDTPDAPAAEARDPAQRGEQGLADEIDANTDAGLTAEELEEIEYEGKKARVPKEFKDAFFRQQDYTRKTQEHADEKRAWEQSRHGHHQMLQLREQTIAEHAEVLALDKQLRQFEHLNWDQIIANDQSQAQKLHMAMMALKDQRAQIALGVSQKQQALTFHQQQETAKQAEEGRRVLERDIKGWSPELAGKLLQTAKNFGFRDEELAQVSDPRTVKLLHEAHLYRQLMSKQAAKPAAQPLPKPVTKLGGAAASNTKALSELSPEEWASRRNEQRYAKRR